MYFNSTALVLILVAYDFPGEVPTFSCTARRCLAKRFRAKRSLICKTYDRRGEPDLSSSSSDAIVSSRLLFHCIRSMSEFTFSTYIRLGESAGFSLPAIRWLVSIINMTNDIILYTYERRGESMMWGSTFSLLVTRFLGDWGGSISGIGGWRSKLKFSIPSGDPNERISSPSRLTFCK